MNEQRKIGIVVPNDFIKRLPFGGASGFIQNVITTVGYPAVIFGSGANGTPLWERQPLHGNATFIATYPLPFPSRYPLRLRALQGYWRNRRRILDSGVSLLYVHSPECALPFLYARERLPVVFHQHGSGNPVTTAKYTWARSRMLERLFDHMHQEIYRRADWIIAIDRFCWDQAVAHGAGHKVSLLMNAVDRSRFRPASAVRRTMRAGHGCGDDELVVLFVGRLEEVKQVDLLIEGLALARSSRPMRMFIAGDGTQRHALEKLTSSCGLADVVSFLGKVSHDRLPEYYTMADVLALPSRMEGVPMVVLEALACGTPVVASAVGGIPDLVRTGENGVLLREVNPGSIASALSGVGVLQGQPGSISETVARWGAEEVGAELSAIFSRLICK
jgi:glycosyltransferase involved in cell wall biosynthesis